MKPRLMVYAVLSCSILGLAPLASSEGLVEYWTCSLAGCHQVSIEAISVDVPVSHTLCITEPDACAVVTGSGWCEVHPFDNPRWSICQATANGAHSGLTGGTGTLEWNGATQRSCSFGLARVLPSTACHTGPYTTPTFDCYASWNTKYIYARTSTNTGGDLDSFQISPADCHP